MIKSELIRHQSHRQKSSLFSCQWNSMHFLAQLLLDVICDTSQSEGTEKEVRSASAASNFEGETATQRRRLQTAKKKKNYCFERLSLCSEQGYIGEARRRRGGGFSKTSSFFLLPLSPSLPDWREIGHVLSTSTSSSHLHFPQSKNTPKGKQNIASRKKRGKCPSKRRAPHHFFRFPKTI